MDVFLAESGSMFKVVHKQGRTFDGINILQSFWYCDAFTEREIIPHARKFLLDSGAFTFFQGKHGNIDWNEYQDRYIEFINRNDVDLFFELDIDSIIGYENVLRLRNRLEMATGKKCIPVWHFSRGKDEFLKMCEEYDYVAFGGMLTDGVPTKKLVQLLPWFVKEAHKRGAKIHGLGFTSTDALKRIQFDSVDSSSWSSSVRFGSMHVFTGDGIKAFNRNGRRVADYKRAALHNFDEWVKFQKYAERSL